MKFHHASLILLIFFFTSCEKAIDIELKPVNDQLVVEAKIETNKPPLVILTKNLNFYSTVTNQLIASSFIKNANVFVTDGDKRIDLSLDSLLSDKPEQSQYFYTYNGTDFLGQVGKQYFLSIQWEGKNYSAKTSIPEITRRIDSLWWEPLIQNKPVDTPLIRVMIKATDKPGLGDYIRYFTKVNQNPFYPGLNSVYDDQIIDGITYIIPIDRGVDKSTAFKENDLYYRPGDTVTVKISNIDRATYDFWRTFEFNYQSVGNPFSSPIKVLGNISNGAFGYFGGYASQNRTVIIPK